jgi:hypothetical protein
MSQSNVDMIELNAAEIAAVAGGKHGADDRQPDDRGNDGPGHDAGDDGPGLDAGDDRGVDPVPHL